MNLSTNFCSDYKRLRKAIRCSNKKAVDHGGPIFSKKGDQVLFKFRHFVNPEQLIQEYIKTYIYDKPVYVRVSEEEVLATTETVNSNDSEIESKKSEQKLPYEKITAWISGNEKNSSERKSEKVAYGIMQKGRQLRKHQTAKRISATHNFVYEFDPFGNISRQADDKISIGKSSSSIPILGDGDNAIRNGKCSMIVQRSSNAELPKLRSHPELGTYSHERQRDSVNCNKSLPNIKQKEREQSKEERTRGKNKYKNFSVITETDREVEKVKSDWQALRRERGWNREKDYTSRTYPKKVYETLEKVTQQIENMQKSYLDPKANQYLHRGAINALESTASVTFEDEAARIRDVLFPKSKSNHEVGRKSLAEASQISETGVSEGLLLSREERSGLMRGGAPKKRSFLSTSHKQNAHKMYRVPQQLPIDFKAKEIRADVDQYLKKYMEDVEENFVRNNKKISIAEPSSEDVAEMLSKLNVEDLESNNKRKDQGITCSEEILDEDDDKFKRYEDFACSTTDMNLKHPTSGKNEFLNEKFSQLYGNFPKNLLSRFLQPEYLDT